MYLKIQIYGFDYLEFWEINWIVDLNGFGSWERNILIQFIILEYYAIDKLWNFDWYLKELLNCEILEKLDFMRKWYLMKILKNLNDFVH